MKNTGLHGKDDVAERLAQEFGDDFWPFLQKPRTKSLPLEFWKNDQLPHLQEVHARCQVMNGSQIKHDISIFATLAKVIKADVETAKRRSADRVNRESGNDTLFLARGQLDFMPFQDSIPAWLPEIARDWHRTFALIDTLDEPEDVRLDVDAKFDGARDFLVLFFLAHMPDLLFSFC